MKKIIAGLFAMAMLSSHATFAGGSKKKAKKAKKVCTKLCIDKKDCTKDPSCVPLPGCCLK